MMCRNPERAAPLKRGISITYLNELADKSDHFQYSVDAAACAALAAIKPASISELSQLADNTVKVLWSDEEKAQQTKNGLAVKQLEAKNGTVEQRYTVVVPAFESFFSASIQQTKGVILGYMCSKFGDSLRRGMKIHLTYERETGEKLSEFNIGPSDC